MTKLIIKILILHILILIIITLISKNNNSSYIKIVITSTIQPKDHINPIINPKITPELTIKLSLITLNSPTAIIIDMKIIKIINNLLPNWTNLNTPITYNVNNNK